MSEPLTGKAGIKWVRYGAPVSSAPQSGSAALTFHDFARGPGGQIAHRIGIPIARCRCWRDVQKAFRALLDCNAEEADANMQRVRDAIGVMSSSEVAIACALLHVCDYSWLADEVSRDSMWQRLDYVHGEHRLAVVAAMLRWDATVTADDDEVDDHG
ncbi:hypothetical protein [Azospirillum sp. sgz301742]